MSNKHRTPLYITWSNMKSRCDKNSSHNSHRYIGRGITYISDWAKFPPFRDWALSNGYVEGLQLDRIDNDGNYNPKNCRFITRAENMRNSSCVKLSMEKAREIRNKYIPYKMSCRMLAVEYNVDHTTIHDIVKHKIWREL